MSDKQSNPRISLFQAARTGHLDVVQAYIDEGAPLDDVEPNSGTALCIAAAGGHAHIVDVLLAAGANRYICGGPGLWAYGSGKGVQWDVLSVTRADPALTTLWRSAGLPIERRDNYTMTEAVVEQLPEMRVNALSQHQDRSLKELEELVRGRLDQSSSHSTGPVIARYTGFTAGISSYFEEGGSAILEIGSVQDSGAHTLPPLHCGRVLVKGPLTQIGFAHYSLRRAIELAGLTDPAREIREIFHSFEAPESDGNMTELQMAIE